MDGIVNINKPAGQTSFRVVAAVRRMTGERRVGHAGTLDPAATGVLPILIGQGTRVSQFLAEATKGYRAGIELGVTTDTYDADGQVTSQSDASRVSREQLLAALDSFRGQILQTPPMFSAVKHQGRRLYELARGGVEVKRRPRPVVVHSIELADWQPPVATLEVTCGRGTYIRSLAHDLGQGLGCGACLKSLVRLWYGPFRIEDAISLSRFEESVSSGYWQPLVYPIGTVLAHWAAVVVGGETGAMIVNGHPVTLAGEATQGKATSENRCRAYSAGGAFLGLLRFNRETGLWYPYKVFMKSFGSIAA